MRYYTIYSDAHDQTINDPRNSALTSNYKVFGQDDGHGSETTGIGLAGLPLLSKTLQRYIRSKEEQSWKDFITVQYTRVARGLRWLRAVFPRRGGLGSSSPDISPEVCMEYVPSIPIGNAIYYLGRHHQLIDEVPAKVWRATVESF
jgi:hypothetical protein